MVRWPSIAYRKSAALRELDQRNRIVGIDTAHALSGQLVAESCIAATDAFFGTNPCQIAQVAACDTKSWMTRFTLSGPTNFCQVLSSLGNSSRDCMWKQAPVKS